MPPQGPFLVMRLAPMIGRPASRRRVSVYHSAARLEWALEAAVYESGRDRARGICSAYWIQHRDQPARRKR